MVITKHGKSFYVPNDKVISMVTKAGRVTIRFYNDDGEIEERNFRDAMYRVAERYDDFMVQIRASSLVNIGMIKLVDVNKVILDNDEEVKVSRDYIGLVKDRLKRRDDYTPNVELYD